MRVLAYAKVNLTLEVLNRRADGYHNLRTVFQTVSLSDVLDIDARRARQTRVDLATNVEIPGENLIVRAAHAVLKAAGVTAAVSCRLHKRIPMGAGMGGGSADAAAVLRALPALLKFRIDRGHLTDIAASLGSDIPFFLLGGTALGLDRGTELYPLPDLPALPVLIVSTGLHVSTVTAYRALARSETFAAPVNKTELFAQAIPSGAWPDHCVNDFEESVFAQHPELAALRRKLARTGATAARMTGSGSALFAVYESRAVRDEAARTMAKYRTFRAVFAARRRMPMLTSNLSTSRARSSAG